MTSELHLREPVTIIVTTSSSSSNDSNNSNNTEELQGTVAHLGPVQFAPGSDWVGCRLTGSSVGRGKNNGSVRGVFYFHAGGENNGVFVRRANVKKMDGKSSSGSSGGSKSPSPRKSNIPSPKSASLGRSDSDVAKSPVFTGNSPASSSRENFLRRLEMQQQKQREKDGDGVKDSTVESSVDKAAAADSNATKEVPMKQNADDKQPPIPLTMPTESTDVAFKDKTSSTKTSDLPRGNNQNQDSMEDATLLTFLSTQSNLTSDQTSMDWIKDLDASSCLFLKALASGQKQNSTIPDNAVFDTSGNKGLTTQDPSWVKDVDASSMEYLKNNYLGGGIGNNASGDGSSHSTWAPTVGAATSLPSTENNATILAQREDDTSIKIAKVTRSPQSLTDNIEKQPFNNTVDAPSDKMSSLEHRILTMLENQNNQIQKMQAQLDLMNDMMLKMGRDVKYLGHDQHRDMYQGRENGHIINAPNMGRGMQHQYPNNRPPDSIRVPGFRVPPPPPPLPPAASAPAANNENMPNQDNPPPQIQAVPLVEPPFRRGIFFPLFNYIFQSILHLIRNFRSILLSTAPGRLYRHMRNEAIRRRAFANFDWRGLLKLVVMLAIFTGRMKDRGGNGGGNRNQRQNNRRGQQQQNNGEDTGIGQILSQVLQTAMVFLQAHRVHVLVVAVSGFMVDTMFNVAFLYSLSQTSHSFCFHSH